MRAHARQNPGASRVAQTLHSRDSRPPSSPHPPAGHPEAKRQNWMPAGAIFTMKSMEKPVVVTRHQALVTFLTETGLVPNGTEVITHLTTPEQIRGRNVVGVIPLHLAVHAASVTEIPLAVPPELRGTELTVEQVRQFAGPARLYAVFDLSSDGQAFVNAAAEGGAPHFTIEHAKARVLGN